jgi:hypothetical protein
MALPIAATERTLVHRRSIDVRVYARGNGLWEVDAHIRDDRTKTTALATGPRTAGEPIHDMLLRIVVDERFDIVEAGARSDAVPFPGACDAHGDAYGRLAGLNLMHGFRKAVRERLGGVEGCTHLTELAQILPTAVMQAFAGEVIDIRGDAPHSGQPFQIDRCHAMRSDGDAVRTYYPRWYRPKPAASTGSERESHRVPTP